MSWGKMNFPGFCHKIKMMYRALPIVALVLEMRLQLDRESLFAKVHLLTKGPASLPGHSALDTHRLKPTELCCLIQGEQ